MHPATDLTQHRADIHLSDPALVDIHKTIMMLAKHWAQNTAKTMEDWHQGKVQGAILTWYVVAGGMGVPEDIRAGALDEYYAMVG